VKVSVDQIFQEAVTAHNSGDLEVAKHLYSSILKVEPTHPRVIHNLGLIDLSTGKVESALQLFKEAIVENSSIEQFWISYIDTLISEQQFENAKQAIMKGERKGVAKKILHALEQKLMSVKEGNILIKSPPESEIQKLINHYENGHYEDAEFLAISMTEQFPEHHFSWKVLGVILKQTGRLPESLIANQKSIKLNSKDAEVHNNMGASLTELDRFQDAEVSYRKAIALKPDYADAYNNLGITLKELGKLEEAEAILRQVITIESDFAESYNNLGGTLKELGKLEEAEASFRQAINLKSDFSEAHNNLGSLLMKIGQHREGLNEEMKGAGFISFNLNKGVSLI
jgi:Flp pilus assembly protein TadD